jgi:hypothetical protein
MSLIDWRQFDKELRLKFAEDEPIVTPPDIQMALNAWREINADPRRWAKLDMLQFEHERVVNVIWGVIHTNGFKECAIQTIQYRLQPDGTVHDVKYTHP